MTTCDEKVVQAQCARAAALPLPCTGTEVHRLKGQTVFWGSRLLCLANRTDALHLIFSVYRIQPVVCHVSLEPEVQCRWDGALPVVLRALLWALRGGSVTLRRCDVAVASEVADAAGAADILLHAGGVLQVGPEPPKPEE